MSKTKSAGRPKMAKAEFEAKCEHAMKLRTQKNPKLTTLQIAKAMGYTSRQAIAQFLNRDKTVCRCCQHPLVK